MTDATGGVSNYTGRAKPTQNINAVFDESGKQAVSVDDFLNLMVAQLKNQDFMNPVEDTQFVTQLAQFTSMQSMAEMGAYMKTNYVASLVGQTVTAAKYSVSGALETETGPITRVVIADNEFSVYVNDKKFTLEQIMEYHQQQAAEPAPADNGDEGDAE